MKKAAMKAWVKALRSGHYEQGEGQLVRQDGTFCCLGVACYITGREAVFYFHSFISNEMFDGLGVDLPIAVQKELGLFDPSGHRVDGDSIIINGNAFDSLTAANDEKVSFNDIADYIEKNWQYL